MFDNDLALVVALLAAVLPLIVDLLVGALLFRVFALRSPADGYLCWVLWRDWLLELLLLLAPPVNI